MQCMTRGRWIAYITWMLIGTAATGFTSAALESDRWAPALLLTAVALIGSLIDPEYWGWRSGSRRR